MDRRVKERLIGASILVALIVLVVPELLSGPKPESPPAGRDQVVSPEPTRNVTVDLATSKAPAGSEEQPAQGGAASETASGSATAAATVPAAAALPAATTPPAGAIPPPGAISKTHAASSAGAGSTASVESPASSPISSAHGAWAVQVGSFAKRSNSDGLVQQLKAEGFTAYVLSGGSGPALRYRVLVGPLPDRQSAERMAAKLKALGHASPIVAPAA